MLFFYVIIDSSINLLSAEQSLLSNQVFKLLTQCVESQRECQGINIRKWLEYSRNILVSFLLYKFLLQGVYGSL